MRPIDADALRKQTFKKLHITNSLKDITDLIDEAPTIEPSKSTEQNVADVPIGDLISRADAVEVKPDQLPPKVPTEWINEGMVLVPQHDWIEMQKKLEEDISADRPQVNSNSAEEQIAETCDRPKGEWIDREDSTDMFFLYRYECSVCGGKNVFNSSYCPNCGAHMR